AFRGLPDRPDTRGGCDDAVDAIAALADGALDDVGHRRLAVHLAGCAPCRETAIRVSFFKDDLAHLRPAEPAVTAARTPELGVRARPQPVASERRRVSPGFRWPHLAAAGMVGAIAAAGAVRLGPAVVALAEPRTVAARLDAPCVVERAELDAERA